MPHHTFKVLRSFLCLTGGQLILIILFIFFKHLSTSLIFYMYIKTISHYSAVDNMPFKQVTSFTRQPQTQGF